MSQRSRPARGGGTASMAAAAALLLASAVSGSALRLQPRQESPVVPWITVDPSGSARTIMPAVTTINGHAATVSGAPDYVTRTSAYTLTTAAGVVVTSTGMAPVATATATSGAGAFAQCGNYQGLDAPFCLPKRGSVIGPGKSYYVTWDPRWFGSEGSQVQIQGKYPSGEGFTSGNVTAEAGYYVWNINSDFLSRESSSDLPVQLSLLVYDPANGNDNTAEGPLVTVSNAATDISPHGKGNGRTVAIAVPVVLAVVILSVAGFCLWWRGRHGRLPALGRSGGGGFGGQPGQGSGPGQSRSQRVGEAGAAPAETDKSRGIQLTDRGSWSPTQGRNVFREEIERQERAGS